MMASGSDSQACRENLSRNPLFGSCVCLFGDPLRAFVSRFPMFLVDNWLTRFRTRDVVCPEKTHAVIRADSI